MHRCGIHHVVGTPYYPQANGQVERFNCTMIDSLSTQCETEQVNWDLFLSGTVFAYNTSKHNETGLSPFKVLFGRKATLPIDMLIGDRKEIDVDVQDYNIRHTYNMRNAFNLLKQFYEKSAKVKNDKWNEKAFPVILKEGDYV